MHRRTFLGRLLAVPLAAIVVPEIKRVFLWDVNRIDFRGVSYHQSNASTGTWLGLDRRPPSAAEIVDLEIRRITPRIKELFERNDMFYSMISKEQ